MRTARAIVLQEPRGKNAGRRDAPGFRAAVREQIADLATWPRPRALLAVDLGFTTSARQPPRLDNIPKNYLDLLGATKRPATDAGGVLYRDDRAVKMLFVSCRHRWDPLAAAKAPHIHVTARTRVDALADMALACEVARNLDIPINDRGFPSTDACDRWYGYGDDRACEGVDDPAARVAWIARQLKRQDAQEAFLANNDEVLRCVFLGSGGAILAAAPAGDPLWSAARKLLLEAFRHLTLPGEELSRLVDERS